jgi:ABC-type Fe3+-hydroxamate transport system substrate-binding protein
MKRLSLIGPALLLAACGSATDTTASTATITQTGTVQPTATQTVGRTPLPPAGPKTVISADGIYRPVIDNDGTYLVGADVDVPPGKYRNAGGTDCYWARLRSLDTSDIIDSKKTSSPQVIRIRLSDTAFSTQNCGTWQWISLF